MTEKNQYINRYKESLDSARSYRPETLEGCHKNLQYLHVLLKLVEQGYDAEYKKILKLQKGSLTKVYLNHSRPTGKTQLFLYGPYVRIKVDQVNGKAATTQLGIIDKDTFKKLDDTQLKYIDNYKEILQCLKKIKLMQENHLQFNREIMEASNACGFDAASPFAPKTIKDLSAIREEMLEYFYGYMKRTLFILKGQEAILDQIMIEYNSQIPSRYHSLILKWKVVHHERTGIIEITEPFFAIIENINKSRQIRSSLPVYKYKRKISKDGVNTRDSGYITKELISHCRLGRYKQLILETQSALIEPKKRWIKYNETIHKILVINYRIENISG